MHCVIPSSDTRQQMLHDFIPVFRISDGKEEDGLQK
jgi:hypothetical protein